jgi:hypothetical protein
MIKKGLILIAIGLSFFELSGQHSSKKPNIGFIAHEVQECFPELVEGEKDGKHYQSLYMSQMIPILVKEIQRLKADNTQLKSDVRYMKDILMKLCID